MSTKRIHTSPEIDDILANLAAKNAELEDRVKFYEDRYPELKQAYAEHQTAHRQPGETPPPE
jgi:hypothetical protein